MAKKNQNIDRHIDHFLSYLGIELNRSPNTLSSYQEDLRHFAEYLQENKISLLKLNIQNLDAYLSEHLKKNHYEMSTLARQTSSLRSFLTFLQQNNIIADNPGIYLDSPKLATYFPQSLTVEEVEALFLQAELQGKWQWRDKALLELLYGGGLRISEALNLRIHQVQLDEAWIIPVGKGNKQRLIPLGSQSLDTLKTWITQERLKLNPQSDHVI
ncbi:MAG: site-specific integrase, partial [Fibrobacter sp.]|nr:site-specific integrase [Fibrobacter sp.]